MPAPVCVPQLRLSRTSVELSELVSRLVYPTPNSPNTAKRRCGVYLDAEESGQFVGRRPQLGHPVEECFRIGCGTTVGEARSRVGTNLVPLTQREQRRDSGAERRGIALGVEDIAVRLGRSQGKGHLRPNGHVVRDVPDESHRRRIAHGDPDLPGLLRVRGDRNQSNAGQCRQRRPPHYLHRIFSSPNQLPTPNFQLPTTDPSPSFGVVELGAGSCPTRPAARPSDRRESRGGPGWCRRATS